MGDLVGNKALTTQSDPALVLQQALANREKQYAGITNPQQQLAARLGGLLGGGLVNVAQDRNFFDINDPLLTRVTQIQGVYNDVASRIDPAADPAKFYSELQSAYSAAGLGREALAASQEAQKAKVAGMDMQIKEADLYAKSPELLAGKIESALMSGNDPEAMRLAQLKTRLDKNIELSQAKTEADIKASLASAGYHNAGILKIQEDIKNGKVEVKPVVGKDELGNPLTLGYTFLNKSTQEEKFVKTDPEVIKAQMEAYKDNSSKIKKPDGSKAVDTTTGSQYYKDVQVPPTDGQPRARGKMEQMELDKLAEKKRTALEADKPRQESLTQGREYWNKAQAIATANGLVPTSTGYFGQIVYTDPRTGTTYTADQLLRAGE